LADSNLIQVVGPEPVLPGALDGRLTSSSKLAEIQVLHEDRLRSVLDPRERDILRGIARGASNKEIARELGIAETTVKIHVQHVLRKLGFSSRVQAAVAAAAHDLL